MPRATLLALAVAAACAAVALASPAAVVAFNNEAQQAVREYGIQSQIASRMGRRLRARAHFVDRAAGAPVLTLVVQTRVLANSSHPHAPLPGPALQLYSLVPSTVQGASGVAGRRRRSSAGGGGRSVGGGGGAARQVPVLADGATWQCTTSLLTCSACCCEPALLCLMGAFVHTLLLLEVAAWRPTFGSTVCHRRKRW